MSKYYEQGNFELQTKAFTGTATNPSYTGEVKSWFGLMELSLESSQDTTAIAADDDANYLEMVPPMVLSGTIKISGMKLSDYEELFNVRRSANNGAYLFGSRGQNKTVGISFKNTGFDENGEFATNKFILYRAQITLPAIGTQSLNETGDVIRDFTMNVKASYIKYSYIENGITRYDTATYGAYNSVDHAGIWDTIKDEILLPTVNETMTVTRDSAETETVTATKNGTTFDIATGTFTAGDVLVFTTTATNLKINGETYTSGSNYTATWTGINLIAKS